jgi:hypothetical protein
MSDRLQELMNVCRPEDLGQADFLELQDAVNADDQLARALKSGFQKDKALASELADVPPPAGLEARLLAAMQTAAAGELQTAAAEQESAADLRRTTSKRNFIAVAAAFAVAATVLLAVFLWPTKSPPLGSSQLVQLGMEMRSEVSGQEEDAWQRMRSAPLDAFPVSSPQSGVRVFPTGWTKIKSNEFADSGVAYDVSGSAGGNHVAAYLFVFPKGERQVNLSLGGPLRQLPEASGGYLVAAKQTSEHVYVFVMKGNQQDFRRWTIAEGDLAMLLTNRSANSPNL